MKKTKRKRDGYLLVEAMVAVTVATTGLLSLMGLLSKSVSLNRVAARRATANYLAAEGVEIVKNMIDSNIVSGGVWNEGFSGDGDWEADFTSQDLMPYENKNLLFDQDSGFYGYGTGTSTLFNRKISISLVSGDEIKVDSMVSWRDLRGAEMKVDIEDHFFNWRTNP